MKTTVFAVGVNLFLFASAMLSAQEKPAATHVDGPNSGFWAVKLTAAQRRSHNISAESLALKVTSIWGKWARDAGLQHGDVVERIDGLTSDISIKQLQTHLQMNKTWQDNVSIIVRRKGRRIELSMRLPNEPKD